MGGVDTIEAVNLLELARLRSFGPSDRSAESLFWLIQITNNQYLSYDSELVSKRYPGRDFSPKSRATKESAALIWERNESG